MSAAMEIMVEFRAGIACYVDGQVTPDTRKGMLRVALIEDLVHLQWLVRAGREATGPPEIDIVIFPEEADVLPVQHYSNSYASRHI